MASYVKVDDGGQLEDVLESVAELAGEVFGELQENDGDLNADKAKKLHRECSDLIELLTEHVMNGEPES